MVDFAKRMEMAVGNTVFQKRQEQRVTYWWPILRPREDVQSCGQYRRIKLMGHTMKWERVTKARLRAEVATCEQQYGFMPKRVLMMQYLL